MTSMSSPSFWQQDKSVTSMQTSVCNHSQLEVDHLCTTNWSLLPVSTLTVLVKHQKEIRATGNCRGGIPKIYGPCNSRCELPEFWRFPKIVFWILIVRYYVKSDFFELCFGEHWAVVPHFEFMELLHDLLRPEATNSNLFSQQHCQYDLNMICNGFSQNWCKSRF